MGIIPQINWKNINKAKFGWNMAKTMGVEARFNLCYNTEDIVG